MDENIKILLSILGQDRVKFEEPLSHHVFSKMGGPAQYFYTATTQKELIEALDIAIQLRIPYFLIGNGTKMMIAKSGLRGFVIKNRSHNVKINGIKGKVSVGGIGVEEALVEVDSGLTLGKLNEFLAMQNLKSVHAFSSLNSTVGGAIFLDPNLVELIGKIKIWDDGRVEEIDIHNLRRGLIILSVVLKIKAK